MHCVLEEIFLVCYLPTPIYADNQTLFFLYKVGRIDKTLRRAWYIILLNRSRSFIVASSMQSFCRSSVRNILDGRSDKYYITLRFNGLLRICLWIFSSFEWYKIEHFLRNDIVHFNILKKYINYIFIFRKYFGIVFTLKVVSFYLLPWKVFLMV